MLVPYTCFSHSFILSQAGRQTGRQAGRQEDRQAGRQVDKQAGRKTDRQAGDSRQADIDR